MFDIAGWDSVVVARVECSECYLMGWDGMGIVGWDGA